MNLDRTLTDEAVKRGILTETQAGALAELAAELADPQDPAYYGEEEAIRFVSGFGDIFVTIGILLFLGSAAALLAALVGTAAAMLGCAVFAWALAEYFTRRRHMALPSIVLLVAFALASFFLLMAVGGALFGDYTDPVLQLWYGYSFIFAGLVTAGLVALHFWRFQVPITAAAGVAAVWIAVFFTVSALVRESFEALVQPLTMFFGLATFAIAMWFDLSDKQRVTNRSAIAFWLHLLAAPLIVHSLAFSTSAGRAFFEGVAPETVSTGSALTLLAGFLLLGLIAVLVDRRALLVSGMTYAGYAFGTLIFNSGFGDITTPLTLFVLGAFVLILSAGWRPLRHWLIGFLPPNARSALPETAQSG